MDRHSSEGDKDAMATPANLVDMIKSLIDDNEKLKQELDRLGNERTLVQELTRLLSIYGDGSCPTCQKELDSPSSENTEIEGNVTRVLTQSSEWAPISSSITPSQLCKDSWFETKAGATVTRTPPCANDTLDDNIYARADRWRLLGSALRKDADDEICYPYSDDLPSSEDGAQGEDDE
jgi:hypothetical protein